VPLERLFSTGEGFSVFKIISELLVLDLIVMKLSAPRTEQLSSSEDV
jgi:hypothetical protein